MKKLFIIAMLVNLFMHAHAQNGGQSAENNVVKIRFTGSHAGEYYFEVTSKQNCPADYKVSYPGLDSVITIPTLGTVIIEVDITTGATFKVKAIQATTCTGQPDMGWVEVTGLIVVPLRLTSFTAKKINASVQLSWIAEDVTMVEVQRSQDAINFQTLYKINSSQILDLVPADGDNFYRLKLFDASGSFIYSPVRRVSFEKKSIIVAVYNRMGQRIANEITSLGPGLYIARYNNGNFKYILK